MRVLLSFILLLGYDVIIGQVTFLKNDWEGAKAQALEKKMPIFVFATIDGCGPCLQMEKEVFFDSAVTKLLRERYINVEVNGRHGQGLEFVKHYRVYAYPTLLFFDSAARLINITRTNLTKNSFLQLSKFVLKPSNRTPALIKKFKSQKVDTTFLKNLIRVLAAAGNNTGPPIDSLFTIKKLEFSYNNLQYLKYLNSCNSTYLDFVIDNRRKYFEVVDAAPYIHQLFTDTARRLFLLGEFSEVEYQALIEKVRKAQIFGWEDQLEIIQKKYNRYKTQIAQ